jgi:hypothetical protein
LKYFIENDFVIREGKEVHYHTYHIVPSLIRINAEGLESYRSCKKISCNQIKVDAERLELAKKFLTESNLDLPGCKDLQTLKRNIDVYEIVLEMAVDMISMGKFVTADYMKEILDEYAYTSRLQGLKWTFALKVLSAAFRILNQIPEFRDSTEYEELVFDFTNRQAIKKRFSVFRLTSDELIRLWESIKIIAECQKKN